MRCEIVCNEICMKNKHLKISQIIKGNNIDFDTSFGIILTHFNPFKNVKNIKYYIWLRLE